jgi:hypothetical protein
MTKKQKALRGILYPVGVATSVCPALISFYWVFKRPGGMSSILFWVSLFAAGFIGVALVRLILRDDITQYLPFLKRKPHRITLYTLGVISGICYLYYYIYLLYYSAPVCPPHLIFSNVNLLSIASGLTATFTVGCIGSAIISLILRDYNKQPPPFLRHKPLLIASYAIAAIGGISLLYSVGLVPFAKAIIIPVILALVCGVCIGLAAVSLAFRDDLTQHFPFLMHRPLRITLYVFITASFCAPSLLMMMMLFSYLFGGDPFSFVGSLEVLVLGLVLMPTSLLTPGSAGFAAATILLRGNMERNLSIAGIIIGVCLLITLGPAVFQAASLGAFSLG